MIHPLGIESTTDSMEIEKIVLRIDPDSARTRHGKKPAASLNSDYAELGLFVLSSFLHRDLTGFVFQHHRNVVAYGIGQLTRRANKFRLVGSA